VGALKAPGGEQFHFSYFNLFSAEKGDGSGSLEMGVQKRESEMNPRSIFSLGLQTLTKPYAIKKQQAVFLKGHKTIQFQETLDRKTKSAFP